MWLICSNRKLYNKKTIFFPPWHNTTISFVIDSLNIFTAQIVHSYMYWAKTHPLADQNVHGLQKMFSTNYHAKATRTVLLDWNLAMGAFTIHPVPWSSEQQRFVWSKTDTLTITSTSQLIVTSAHHTVIAKALDSEEYLVTNLLNWPWPLSLCHCVRFENKSATKSFVTPHFLHTKSFMIFSRSESPRISCSMLRLYR